MIAWTKFGRWWWLTVRSDQDVSMPSEKITVSYERYVSKWNPLPLPTIPEEPLGTQDP